MGNSFQNDLIIDVGMHRGEDAEFYLQKGFRVVAIEADPALVAIGRERLAAYLDGRVEIINIAVAPYAGEIEFFSSEHEGWGSAIKEIASAQSQLAVTTNRLKVPCAPLGSILGRYGIPYYLKIDIEGGDKDCISALGEFDVRPKYVSVECDLLDRESMFSMYATLWSLGYRQFKVINQVLNPSLRCPNPPREGKYVDAQFTLMMSGLFGEETPGEWLTIDRAWDRYVKVAREQWARSHYAATGRLFGVPIGRFHRQLKWLYNAAPVGALRRAYARLRRYEVGGWFDLHARFGAE